MKLELKKKKITQIGGSRGFIVGSAYFNDGYLSEDKEYDLTITPSKKDEG